MGGCLKVGGIAFLALMVIAVLFNIYDEATKTDEEKRIDRANEIRRLLAQDWDITGGDSASLMKEIESYRKMKGDDSIVAHILDSTTLALDSISIYHREYAEAEAAAAAERRAKADKTLSSFRKKHDEFKKVTWYYPSSAPQYDNRNAVYSYFYMMDDRDQPANLRFKVQYAADEWLFVEKYIFLIDGNRS